MSADKERSLARRVAYLRRMTCVEDGRVVPGSGLSLQVKWGMARTADMDRMVADGHATVVRITRGDGSKGVTTLFATRAGADFLAATLSRKGDGFGPASLLAGLQPRAERKEERARRLAPHRPGFAEARRARRTRALALRAEFEAAAAAAARTAP